MTSTRVLTPRGYWRGVPVWERRDVTVCIAATCHAAPDERCIVLCTDRKVGGALGSAETMLKSRAIGKNWRCLTSGTDSEIYAMTLLLAKYFKGAKQIDETNVVQLIRDALHERKRDKINELIQGKYAIPYNEFLTVGKDKLPSDLFRAAVAEVEMTELAVDLVVVGFIGKFPWMIETTAKGSVKIREDFAVAGEGGYLAQASLLHRGHSDQNSLETTVYNVFEAKKFAEGAPSVGRYTLQTVMYPDGRDLLTSVFTDRRLADLYVKYGPKNIGSDFDLKVDSDFYHKYKE